ncbi:MAG: oligosaccharide flippase family protein [Eubacterium sp.]|nr:oligosaccharide flippase family protein [Eubacterium sp.]
MNKNKQLAINLTAQIVGFVVNFGIGFFLSPFIVRTVGSEAYGFVSLGNNFVTYATLLSTALNSMASRFVTIHYVKDDYKNANAYFSSVFFSNVFLAVAFTIPATFIVLFLEKLVNISPELVYEVKILWTFIFLNFLISIVGSIFAVATFTTNKLYLSSIRSIIAQLIRAAILFVSFSLMPKYIWYIGVASLAQNLYCTVTNIFYTKKLVPELKVKRSYFDIKKIKELLSSGVWNSINSLGSTLLESLDLLIANLFVGSKEMGILSVAKTVPSLISSLISTVVGIFMPTLTINFAKDDKQSMIDDIKLSMKITGLVTCVPISVFIILGDSFYSLWQPTLDSKVLQILSVLSISSFLVSGVVNVIFSVLTVANKVKVPAIVQVGTGLANTLIVLMLVNVTDLGIYVVAGVSGILCIIKNLFIIFPYACKCIGIKKSTFYPEIIKCLIAIVISCFVGLFVDKFVNIDNWINLIFFGIIYALIGFAIYIVFCTNKSDRAYLKNIVLKAFKKKTNI